MVVRVGYLMVYIHQGSLRDPIARRHDLSVDNTADISLSVEYIFKAHPHLTPGEHIKGLGEN